MIEVVSAARCTKCDICIRVCPTNVFDRGDDGVPVIARQSDCQTCFMCEAYCPEEAVFVAHPVVPVEPDSPYRDEQYVTEHNLLGLYRRSIGWNTRPPRHQRAATGPAGDGAEPNDTRELSAT
jgi:NAD-dependent dihydropyrimidine dehydrogenase PreA subunit